MSITVEFLVPPPSGFVPTPVPVRLISFGYLHQSQPPDASLVIDVRNSLRDPAAARHILDLDGRHHTVQEVVLNTPGALATLRAMAFYAGFTAAFNGPSTIAVGCAGGRHRSVALVELCATGLESAGYDVQTTHLHVHLPRVMRT